MWRQSSTENSSRRVVFVVCGFERWTKRVGTRGLTREQRRSVPRSLWLETTLPPPRALAQESQRRTTPVSREPPSVHFTANFSFLPKESFASFSVTTSDWQRLHQFRIRFDLHTTCILGLLTRKNSPNMNSLQHMLYVGGDTIALENLSLQQKNKMCCQKLMRQFEEGTCGLATSSFLKRYSRPSLFGSPKA